MGNYIPGYAFNYEDTVLTVNWGAGEKELSVSSNDTISVIKKRLGYLTGFPVNEHKLMYRHKELENTWILGSYNLPTHAKIDVLREKKFGKPVIRLRSMNGQLISNVHVHLHLNNVWILSSIYPQSANSDGISFVEWNNIEVHPNGQLMIKQRKQETNSSKLLHCFLKSVFLICIL
jgi:hypothetical protein